MHHRWHPQHQHLGILDHDFKVDKTPRTPNWNASGKGKHWLLDQRSPLTNYLAKIGDQIVHHFQWRSLLSVDDILLFTKKFEEMGELDNTYFIYSSDHGYNLGQFVCLQENFMRLKMMICGCLSYAKRMASILE